MKTQKYSDSLYNLISTNEYEKFVEDSKQVNIESNEFENIKSLLNKYGILYKNIKSDYGEKGTIQIYVKEEMYVSKERKSYLTHYIVRKFDDDWWIIEDCIAVREFKRWVDMYNQAEGMGFMDDCFYKCDSIDGVYQFFENHFKYNNRPKRGILNKEKLIDNFKEFTKRKTL